MNLTRYQKGDVQIPNNLQKNKDPSVGFDSVNIPRRSVPSRLHRIYIQCICSLAALAKSCCNFRRSRKDVLNFSKSEQAAKRCKLEDVFLDSGNDMKIKAMHEFAVPIDDCCILSVDKLILIKL